MYQHQDIARKVVLGALLLVILSTGPAAADDPPQLGNCASPQKVGDVCVTGICVAGKQTVYKCNKEMRCMKQEEKQDCEEKAKTKK